MSKKIDKQMYVKLGDELRKAREKKKYSLEFVADKVGLTKKTIQRYETAESRISINVLYDICGLLDLDPYTLSNFFEINFHYDDNPERVRYGQKPIMPINGTGIVDIPLYSSISCGKGMFVDDDIEEFITLPDSLLDNKREYFCQYADGDSMIGENINPGDLIVFEKTQSIENGQIGCFCIDDNIATCKKFYKDDASAIITLQPANNKYSPIIVTVETMNFHIIGKLCLVISKRQ